MLYINDGIRIEKLEAIFDKEETELLEKVRELGYPTGHELRKIAEELKGEWLFLNNGKYDILNMPFREAGIVIIERPFTDSGKCAGCRVAYSGKIYPGLDEQLQTFVESILVVERYDAKNGFINSASIDTASKHVKEIAKLFDK